MNIKAVHFAQAQAILEISYNELCILVTCDLVAPKANERHRLDCWTHLYVNTY